MNRTPEELIKALYEDKSLMGRKLDLLVAEYVFSEVDWKGLAGISSYDYEQDWKNDWNLTMIPSFSTDWYALKEVVKRLKKWKYEVAMFHNSDMVLVYKLVHTRGETVYSINDRVIPGTCKLAIHVALDRGVKK